MSDAEQNLEVEQEIDYKAMYEKTLNDLNTVAAKKDELYKETKKAKADRDAKAAETQRLAEEQAKKNGEFEKLWKTASTEKEQLVQKLEEIKNSNRQEKLTIAAMKVATELADGPNAELLSEFVKKDLSNMADENGLLSDDVMKAVTDEFKNNEKFKALLRSSKAQGGSAPGNMRSSTEKQSITRAEFDKMNPQKRADFITKVRNGSADLIDN